MDDKWNNNDPLCRFVYKMITTKGFAAYLFDQAEYDYSKAKDVPVKATRLATRTLPPPYGQHSDTIKKKQKTRFYRAVGNYIRGSHSHSFKVTMIFPVTFYSVQAKTQKWIIDPDATVIQLAEILQTLIRVED